MDFHFSDSDSETQTELAISLAPQIDLQEPSKSEALQPSVPLKKIEMDKFEFNKQFYTYENFGYATNPVNKEELIVKQFTSLSDKYPSVYEKSSKTRKDLKKDLKAKRKTNDDPASPGFLGPWAHYEGEELLFQGRYQEIDEEQKAKLALFEEKRQKKLQEYKENPTIKDYERTKITINEAKITKHVDTLTDYQNRSIFIPPSELKMDPNSVAYIPKKCKQTLAGHTSGVQCIKFHKDGHLMISCSLDHTIKIWDAVGTKKCIQTYAGHSNSVRDLC